MKDNDVPGMTDGRESKITAVDDAEIRKLFKTSDITHCIRCAAPALSGGDLGWVTGGFSNRLTGDVMLYVHCLVISAFVGSYPPDTECCHWDEKANDNVSNLRWASRSANIKDSDPNGSHNMVRRTHRTHTCAYTPENARISKSGRRRRCVTRIHEDCRRHAPNSCGLKEEARRRYARRLAPSREAA